jgi:hypothetical protein
VAFLANKKAVKRLMVAGKKMDLAMNIAKWVLPIQRLFWIALRIDLAHANAPQKPIVTGLPPLSALDMAK